MRRIFGITSKYKTLSTKYELLLILFLWSTSINAQRPPAHSLRLLESGRAEKVLAAENSPTELKIVSYNIRWRSGKELRQISDWLRNERPAIIALQEVDRAKERSGRKNHARALAEELGMYYAWAAPPLPKNTKGEEETGVELLSPYALSDITRLVLPHAGPSGRWRVALGATIRIDQNNVRVYSVHSETRIQVSEKIDQLRAVLDDLKRFSSTTPAVIMGDFNSWEPQTIKAVAKLFTSSGFETPFPDDQPTFMRKIVLFDLELKLDWVWLRGVPPKSFGIDRQLTVSDHFPLWTVAGWKSRGTS